jgi:alkylation response protein AidB-like acyl-CoA dehydrogenase
LSKRHEEIWREEAAGYHLPIRMLSISHGMCLPVIVEFGTVEQKKRHVARLISGEELWAQMFSEPGAGSDVASLQTSARHDDQGWVIDGQKVWTTFAHLCDHGLVLARTNRDVPKHRGLSMFIVDLRSPGVEIRPLRQLTGRSDFNEVFFTGVRVADDALVGPLDEGWRVATAMLMYERVSIGSGAAGDVRHRQADALIALAETKGVAGDPVLRQCLAQLWSAEVVQSILAIRTQADQQAGRAPGPSGSIGKLFGASIAVLVRDLTFRVLGADGTAWAHPDGASLPNEALKTLSSGIAGGTNEIQRNILGERVLGLPREPAVDRDVPFRDVRLSVESRS